MRVIVDPADNILYKSYYIYSLAKVLGEGNITFSSKPFQNLSSEARNSWSIRFVVDYNNGKIDKYVISCNDSYHVIEELYNWCDVFASVNANKEKVHCKYRSKLLSLCPSFAVKCWDMWKIPFWAIQNAVVTKPDPIKKYLGRYKALLSKAYYDEYLRSEKVCDNYVFFVSTLWYNDDWNQNDKGVNLRRSNFIRACKNISTLNFEGGLVSQGPNRSSERLFSDCLSKGYSFQDWMVRTKRSICVFNTPAFWDCHG